MNLSSKRVCLAGCGAVDVKYAAALYDQAFGTSGIELQLSYLTVLEGHLGRQVMAHVDV